MAQSLEQWGYGLEEGREDGETGGDDADVAFDVEPDSQVNEGVGCIVPVDCVDEEDTDDGRYADTGCWEKVESAVVCVLEGY